MLNSLDLSGLTSEQINQIDAMIQSFRSFNQQTLLVETLDEEFDPTPLFFESDILQPFNRSMLYGSRA